MLAAPACRKCGSALFREAPDGLCGKCVRQVTFEAGELADADEFDGAGTFIHPASPTSFASALVQLKREMPGEVIGNYRLVEELGEGGFGVVWVADQERPVRRRVALKIIKPGVDSRDVIARFEQERQALDYAKFRLINRGGEIRVTDRAR